MSLLGWETKSIRENNAQIAEAYTLLKDGEAWLIGCYINPLKNSNAEMDPTRSRKLLLNKKELKKLQKEIINSSNTIIPLKLFINEKGLAKIEISLAKGKKLYDKRETIKDKDNKKALDRLKKIKNQK